GSRGRSFFSEHHNGLSIRQRFDLSNGDTQLTEFSLDDSRPGRILCLPDGEDDDGINMGDEYDRTSRSAGETAVWLYSIKIIESPAINHLRLSAAGAKILEDKWHGCIRHRSFLVEGNEVNGIRATRFLLRVDLVFGTVQLYRDVEIGDACS